MRSVKLVITISCFVLTIQNVMSQRDISGVVLDHNNVPLVGATVFVKNTLNGTQTDFDGGFSLTINEKDVVVVSYVGFSDVETTVDERDFYSILLKEDLSVLDEVVVVGYGTQQKAISTSSVSQVKGEALATEPVANLSQALQGKAAGVQVVASDAPGAASTIVIRGVGTVLGGRNPLYVVDGVLTDNINNVNPSDIESVSVLKDAASLAIYGNRAANGVVIVTTKKGRVGKFNVSFDSYKGGRSVLSKVKMANSAQYVVYNNEGSFKDYLKGNNASFFSDTQNYDTDWFDAITRVGVVSNYNLSIVGGSEKIQNFFSVGLNKEKGILKGNNFERLTVRNNINYNLSESLSFSNNISVQIANLDVKNYDVFTTAYKQSPTVPARNEAGNFGSSAAFNNVGNPLADLFYQDESQKYQKTQATFKIEYEMFENLKLTSRFSIESEGQEFVIFNDHIGRHFARYPETVFTDKFENDLKVKMLNKYRWYWDNYFTYDRIFKDKHHVNVTLGITKEDSEEKFVEGTSVNLPVEKHLKYNLNNGSADDRSSFGEVKNGGRLFSYISRFNYDFNKKYLFNVSYRRDGSSNFQRPNKFGDFYAVSAGWVLSQEAFMEEFFFDELKLRVSYGELGNQNIDGLNVATASLGSDVSYPFGVNQEIQDGITIEGTVDENLTWEKTTEFNFGLDFSILEGRLTGVIDYYNRKNTNAILSVRLPDVFGFKPFFSHVGEVQNSGIETDFNWSDSFGELDYNIGLNVSYNKNELTKVNNPYYNQSLGGSLDNGVFTKKVQVGQPLGSFFLHEVKEIDNDGNFVYKDLNNDGMIDDEDKKFFGSYMPKFNLGFNIGLRYKNLDILVDTYTSLGSKVYNGKKAQRFSKENIEASSFNRRWTSGRPSNTDPSAFQFIPVASNYYLESGDFFRLNNVTIGYTIPKIYSSFFSKVRIYATAKNPLIFKKFSGFTPELPGNGDPLGTAGIELNAYPTLKSFYIGINTSF